MILIAVRKLCGQVWGGPSGVLDQSWLRISAPISPPPARKLSDETSEDCSSAPTFAMRRATPAPQGALALQV